MYHSTFITPHDLPEGTTSIGGMVCQVAKGRLSCSSIRIQKSLARKLSTQFGICQYDWKNDIATGSVVYRNGQKKSERFDVT